MAIADATLYAATALQSLHYSTPLSGRAWDSSSSSSSSSESYWKPVEGLAESPHEVSPSQPPQPVHPRIIEIHTALELFDNIFRPLSSPVDRPESPAPTPTNPKPILHQNFPLCPFGLANEPRTLLKNRLRARKFNSDTFVGFVGLTEYTSLSSSSTPPAGPSSMTSPPRRQRRHIDSVVTGNSSQTSVRQLRTRQHSKRTDETVVFEDDNNKRQNQVWLPTTPPYSSRTSSVSGLQECLHTPPSSFTAAVFTQESVSADSECVESKVFASTSSGLPSDVVLLAQAVTETYNAPVSTKPGRKLAAPATRPKVKARDKVSKPVETPRVTIMPFPVGPPKIRLAQKRKVRSPDLVDKKGTSPGRPFTDTMKIQLIMASRPEDIFIAAMEETQLVMSHAMEFTSKEKLLAYSQYLYDSNVKGVLRFDNTRIAQAIRQVFSIDDFHFVQVIRPSTSQDYRVKNQVRCLPMLKMVAIPTRPDEQVTCQFLKKMVAHPRYKADMKYYIVPGRLDQETWYYTMQELFLQEQHEIATGQLRVSGNIIIREPTDQVLNVVIKKSPLFASRRRTT